MTSIAMSLFLSSYLLSVLFSFAFSALHLPASLILYQFLN
jgi:hypothetical protein